MAGTPQFQPPQQRIVSMSSAVESTASTGALFAVSTCTRALFLH